MPKAVFLDRDGLINKKPPEHEYVRCWHEFGFLPGVKEAVKKLNEAGYIVIVVTNQRGIARGLMTMGDVDYIHGRMCAEFEKSGARIDAVYVCPHDKGQCACRKPDIGMFLQAERELKVDRPVSWMIGDSASDILAGEKYGVRSIYVGEGRPDFHDIYSDSLPGAVEKILAWEND